MKKSTLSLSILGLCFLSTAYVTGTAGEGVNYRSMASEKSSTIGDLLSGITKLKLSVHSEPTQLVKAKEKLEEQIKIAKEESDINEKLKKELELEVEQLNKELGIEQLHNELQSEKANKLAGLVDEKTREIHALTVTLDDLQKVKDQHEELKLELEKLAKENDLLQSQKDEQILCLLKKQEDLETQIKKLLADQGKVVEAVEKKEGPEKELLTSKPEKKAKKEKMTEDDSDEESERGSKKEKVSKYRKDKGSDKKDDLKEDDYREIYTRYFTKILEQQKQEQQKREEFFMMQIMQQMEQRSILNEMNISSAPDSTYNPAAYREMGMLNYMSQIRDRSANIQRGYSPSYLDKNMYQGLNTGLSFHDQYVRDVPMYFNSAQSYQPQQFSFDNRGYNFQAPSITNSSLAGTGIPSSAGNLSGDFVQIF